MSPVRVIHDLPTDAASLQACWGRTTLLAISASYSLVDNRGTGYALGHPKL